MSESNKKIRVRFAPSPTGYLHIGGARTALFNFFLAKKSGGDFILRIEDTDTERLKEDSVSQILSSMQWLGMDWDEGPDKEGQHAPYYQSQRQELYTKEAMRLLEEGKAYYCFCTPEDLAKEREVQKSAGGTFSYSGHCRNISLEDAKKRLANGETAVIRIKSPEAGETIVHDLIRGDVRFDNSQIDDFIIVKSNGLPAYNFACAIDDSSMEITHVIRAEEHLSNTPKQIHLYEKLGYNIPQFAHISMILAPDRSKLSKRHGATSVEEYREQGIVADALVNYLTLLGWSPGGETEIFTRDETIEKFSLERVHKTAAVYDIQKLVWMNGHYIAAMPLDELVREAMPFFLKENLVTSIDQTVSAIGVDIRRIVASLQSRSKTLVELAQNSCYFFRDVDGYNEKGLKNFRKDGAAERLNKVLELFGQLSDFEHDTIELAFKKLAETMGIKTGELIHPTRLALTGRTEGPSLFELISMLGKDNCIPRIEKAIAYLPTMPAAE